MRGQEPNSWRGRAFGSGLVRHGLIAGVALALHPGCSDDNPEILATIGEEEVTLSQLLEFVERTPERLRSQKPGAEAMRDHLQSLIDMQLMELEARGRDLHEDPGFQEEFGKLRRKRLIAELLRRHLEDQGQLGTEELRRRYVESKWSRQLQLAHIELAGEAEAQKALAEIRGGRSFEEVALEMSRDEATSGKGGVIERFLGREHIEDIGLPLKVAEELFDLPVGEVSRAYELGDGYEIFKIVGETASPNWYGDVFARKEQQEQSRRLKNQLVRELAEKYRFRLDSEGLAFLLEKAAHSDAGFLRIPDDERDVVLCRFDGGQVTLQDFSDAYRQVWFYREVRFDSTGIAEFVDKHMLEEAILVHEAEMRGLDRDEQVVSWLAGKEESMLVHALKEAEVDAGVDTSEAEIRRYFESHTGRFMLPEEACVVEVLVGTEEEANTILERARRGESLKELAVAYSIRQGLERHGGQFCLHPYERLVYGRMLEIAMRADYGELQGPVKVRHGYSVFTVTERLDARPETFEEARTKARWWLRKSQEKRLFEELMDRLRSKFKSRVIVYEDRLAPIS